MKHKKTKKVLSAVVTVILCIAAILCFSTIFGSILHDDPSVFGFRCFYVMTGSMEPTIPTDTLVFTRKNPDGVYAVGDIITFASPDPALGGSSNTHRIVEVRNTEEGIRYITQGDANAEADAYPVSPNRIQGRVVGHTGKMKWIGKFVSFVMTLPGFLLVIVIPLVLIIASSMKEYVLAYKTELEKLRKGVAAPQKESDSAGTADDGKK